MQSWEEIERKLAALPEMHKTKQKFLERTSYYGQVVEFDGQGRLLMPQILRETASLKGEVAVMGNLKHLVVRNAEELRKSITEPFTEEDETVLSRLGI
jgi:MraZ protein